MTALTLECPDELAIALGKRPLEVAAEIGLMSALKMFECGRISSGLAASLAGMSRAEFLLRCGEFGVSVFQQTSAELASDTEAALHASSR
jgi:predicted HTH domain antitoxin